jgi:probable HAF family extracellular repeat protein
VPSSAEDINDLGQVTGYSCDADGNCHAFLWQNGTMTDLNTLLSPNAYLYLEFAYFINDSGRIVGQAYQQSTNSFLQFVAIPGRSGGSSEAASSATQFKSQGHGAGKRAQALNSEPRQVDSEVC